MDDFKIDLRPSQAHELDFLQSEFSPNDQIGYHHKRHAIQSDGKGVYLIAWHKNIPVGHFLLRFNGPAEDPTGKFPNGVAYLSEGGTRSIYRRRGVATKLIQKAEEVAMKNNYKKIGLAVGSTDNPTARRLYEKLGYRDWGQGEFEVSWAYNSKNGRSGIESEVCIYMFKDLKQ